MRQDSHSAPRIVHAADDGYPASLRGLAAEFAPDTLWVRGSVPAGAAVAVVGSRRASAASLVAARAISSALASAGYVVVSGGALGVDGAAHRGALDAGGTTVVVLGTGIDVSYPPRHAPLFDEVVARGGAVLSQFPPGSGPMTWAFPRRNATMAALCEVVIVVEAGDRSGALYTSDAALRLGRRVVVLSGSPGTNRLAASGVPHGADADEVVGLVLGSRAPSRWSGESGDAVLPLLPEDPRARQLFEVLDGTPRDVSDLAARAGLHAAEAMSLVIDLEIGGHAARAAGGRYLRLS